MNPNTPHASLDRFRAAAVLKSDHFSTIERGFWRGDTGEVEAVLRRIDRVTWWTRPIARHFLKREARALARIGGAGIGPELLASAPEFLVRAWVPGLPMHLARPENDAAYFREAKRRLIAMHRTGVVHNDLAKEPNWLRNAEGKPRVTDFQLATVHMRRSLPFRIAAREDLRHLLKHKRKYCPAALGAAERRLLARKSWASRIWMATGKQVYNFVTRRILGYMDREGGGDALYAAPRIAARIAEHVGVSAAAVVPYPTARGVRLYAFVETQAALEADEVREFLRGAGAGGGLPVPSLIQIVSRLPRGADGRVREDVLKLVAENQIDLVEHLPLDAKSRRSLTELVEKRLNRSDRRLQT